MNAFGLSSQGPVLCTNASARPSFPEIKLRKGIESILIPISSDTEYLPSYVVLTLTDVSLLTPFKLLDPRVISTFSPSFVYWKSFLQ
ncbi:hypothetical protein AYI68_g3847 [Smittium mucronatum]|uniref:Uncharacterized protein n=1 Tax=Smittium mucronatum TaxID=133383 RepID=A0A1R0GYR5_9FUNG|nr:hypothetical protein AYI68_g3847 [Smittium mucronatum]